MRYEPVYVYNQNTVMAGRRFWPVEGENPDHNGDVTRYAGSPRLLRAAARGLERGAAATNHGGNAAFLLRVAATLRDAAI